MVALSAAPVRRPIAGNRGRRSKIGNHWSVRIARTGGDQSPHHQESTSSNWVALPGWALLAGDWGRTLPDVTINPGGLGWVVTPLVPAVTPVLAVSIDGRGDLQFGFRQELVKLTLGGERLETSPPWRVQGFGPHQGFKDQVNPVG